MFFIFTPRKMNMEPQNHSVSLRKVVFQSGPFSGSTWVRPGAQAARKAPVHCTSGGPFGTLGPKPGAYISRFQPPYLRRYELMWMHRECKLVSLCLCLTVPPKACSRFAIRLLAGLVSVVNSSCRKPSTKEDVDAWSTRKILQTPELRELVRTPNANLN